MTGRVFVDTNVLIYARDRKAEDKRTKAQAWLVALGDTGQARVNLQVVNEFTRWMLANEQGRSLEDVQEEIQALRAWGDKPLDHDEVELGWAVRKRFGYQWFDCLLIAAAELSGCRYFLTEDMSKGAVFGSVKLVDPFRTSPAEILSTH
jgi:predicted nucleic acid-binding protein